MLAAVEEDKAEILLDIQLLVTVVLVAAVLVALQTQMQDLLEHIQQVVVEVEEQHTYPHHRKVMVVLVVPE
jgi:cell division protein FtsL